MTTTNINKSTSLAITLLIITITLILEASCISVPTGKKTPITPAKPTPRPIYSRISRAPIPVHEYTNENPEPAPLDPSYVPITFRYIQALAPNAIYYVPIRVRNYADYRNEKKYNGLDVEQPVVVPREPDYSRPTKRPSPIYYEQQYNTNLANNNNNIIAVNPNNNNYNNYNGAKYITKPLYYLPKGVPTADQRVPTKGGYPKKATSQSSNNKHFYYVNQN